jgi:hypothetical protein
LSLKTLKINLKKEKQKMGTKNKYKNETIRFHNKIQKYLQNNSKSYLGEE